MNSALLLNRRRDFHKKLMDFAKQYHEEFLLALVPPVFLEKDKLTRWHPDFELDKVPDIPAQDIPLPKPQATNTSVKQILEQAKSLLSCNKKMGAALNQIKDPKVTAASSSGEQKEPTTPSSTSDPGSSQAVVENLQKVIKGIPQGLLEKV
ncbi:DNA replication factor Cdt1-like [Diaphorina citri]|uniref:DNA replication factor Cdt1-like n=1 Tax=Diaphorina citri TaxID=121845 RepID=A0A1S3DVX8_DIACI|nr:DNA replication factor Cdt1-like [Diaphorina citri]